MTMIEDGTGTGRKAKVTLDNLLEVLAVNVEEMSYANARGKVWTIPLDALAPSGATWFVVFFNGGLTTYVVHRLFLTTSVAGVFRIAKVSGVPVGGTAITPSAMNLSTSGLPDLCTIQGGVSITGLTETALIAPIYMPANQPVNVETASGIYLPPGTLGLAVKAPAAATINGFISFHEMTER
jgi:hypothetical protein